MNAQAMSSEDSPGATSSRPVALITGASAGIGEAISRRFAAAGYDIVAVARRQEKLDALAQALGSEAQVATISLDVAEPQSARRAVELAIERFGRLDCLVNNAGSGRWAPVHQTDDAAMDEVIDTSLKATFRFCREAVPVMRPGSAIVTVGSTFGLIGGLDGGIYCAVKAALVGLTQTMAAQYGAQGIRSNLIAPGVIKTDMTKDFWDARGFQRLNQEMTPFDREGTPQDVANAVFFLASPEGSYINGQTIALDGGWTTTKYLTMDALVMDRTLAPAPGAAVNG